MAIHSASHFKARRNAMDKALRSALNWWGLAGVDVPEIKPTPRKQLEKPVTHTRSQVDQPSPTPIQSPASELARTAKTLDELKAVMTGFDAGEISDHARQMVFSRGNPEADIMVIGEAPGRDEDIQGKPFVGRSGQLLDKIFASIGLSEDTIYITNVVNWRPPGNRNPNSEEIILCKPFLMRHIALIDPKIIVLVGGISFNALTGRSGIMKNRGQWTHLTVNGHDIPTLPIYHPAFLLRQPALKKDAWRDMISLKMRRGELGL